MDFSVTVKVVNGFIQGVVDAPEANEYTMYAYYLYENNGVLLERKWYRKENTFSFLPTESGIYYIRVFVRSKENAEDEYRISAKNTRIVRFYAVKEIQYPDMDRETFRSTKPTVYRIMWDSIPFEFLINSREDSGRAVVFGTGALQVTTKDSWPLFARGSWSTEIPDNTICYFDPTLYLGELALAWGYGTNERWYLENIAVLLEKILCKLAVDRANVLFCGSSGGGFMSLALASLLHGKAMVINPQICAENYYSSVLEKLKSVAVNQGDSLISCRLDAIKLFCAEQYFPYVHLVQNICAKADILKQVNPFLQRLVEENINCEECLRIDFYGNEKGHEGMPEKDKCLRMIQEDLDRPVSGVVLKNQESGYEPFLERLSKDTL